MKRLSKAKISMILVTMILAVTLVGCSGQTQEDQVKTIRFADVGWDSIRFHNAVAGAIAKNVYGYEWEEVSGSTPITHEAVKKGEIDVHMEEWTDNLPEYEKDLSEGAFKELGINFDDNAQGFYVPKYVIHGDEQRGIKAVAPDLKTVEDLKKYPELFKDPEDPNRGIIYGGISGWSITEIMHKKYLHYGLDETYNYLEPGTDAATSAVLVSAYDKGEPVVAYYWDPTWLLGKYEFVLLEDEPYDEQLYFEGKCECPSVKVTIGASNQFYENNQEYCSFLEKYQTSSALTSEALAYIEETGANYEEAALWFIKEQETLVRTWLNQEQANKLYEEIK